MERNTIMKKRIQIFVAIIVVGILGIGGWYVLFGRMPKIPVQQESVVTVNPSVTCIFNSTTFSDIRASSPYEALVLVTKIQNVELTTKQYDFGVFVEGVGDQQMTKDKVWIYYVNGKSGEVASDKYELKLGDTVEWKYTTPIY
jgi:hypothetical protein